MKDRNAARPVWGALLTILVLTASLLTCSAFAEEKKTLKAEYDEMNARCESERQDEEDVAEFISRLKRYAGATELTREMCLELIEYITLDAYVEGQPREIYIYYKLLDEPLKDKRSLF